VTTHVLIATPEYRGSDHEMRASLYRVQKDLHTYDIRSTALFTRGDSLVTRARNSIVEAFWRDQAYTHLLQWDEDLECLTPDCLRAMLATGHAVIGAAYPLKGTGLCVTPIPDSTPNADGSVAVQEIGTGFFLTSRQAISDLRTAYPERRYIADHEPYRGDELVALFDTNIVDGRYLSEDFEFCRMWRALGEDVFQYEPARFRHWGRRAYEHD
jgi:hypothetical protein